MNARASLSVARDSRYRSRTTKGSFGGVGSAFVRCRFMLSDRFSQICPKISRCFNLDRQPFNPVVISLQCGET
jgi:hypothetical protein